MNSYSTIHDASRIVISAAKVSNSEMWATHVTFYDASSALVQITAFSTEPVYIEGADHINHRAETTA